MVLKGRPKSLKNKKGGKYESSRQFKEPGKKDSRVKLKKVR